MSEVNKLMKKLKSELSKEKNLKSELENLRLKIRKIQDQLGKIGAPPDKLQAAAKREGLCTRFELLDLKPRLMIR